MLQGGTGPRSGIEVRRKSGVGGLAVVNGSVRYGGGGKSERDNW